MSWLKTVWDGLKNLSKLGQVTENLSKLPDVQKVLVENDQLKKALEKENKISELREAFQPDHRGWLELKSVVHGYKPGKYCNLCFETKGVPMLMTYQRDTSFGDSYYCHNCRNAYYL